MDSSSITRDEVEAVLDAQVRPLLATHGGAVEIASLSPSGSVGIRLLGACVGCPAANYSMRDIVRKELMLADDRVSEVVLVSSSSEALMAEARGLLHRGNRRVPLRLSA